MEGNWILNPTFQQLEFSSIDLTVSGSADSIVMVEGGALEVSESDILDGAEGGAEGHQGADRAHQRNRQEGRRAQDGVDQGAGGRAASPSGARPGREGNGQGDQRQGQGGARAGLAQVKRDVVGKLALEYPERAKEIVGGDRGHRVPRHAGAGAREGRAGRRPGHSIPCARSRSKPGSCPGPTARPSSPGARPRRWWR